VGGPGVKRTPEKTFADSASSLLRGLPEYTADAEVEWQLFKADVALSSAVLCGRKPLDVAINEEKRNPLLELRGKRCHSSKESCLQGLASEHSRIFCAFAIH